MKRGCYVCDADISKRHRLAAYCFTCADVADRSGGAGHATAEVAKAVRKGLIPPAKALLCTDCGKQASDYDHRDYNTPLAVEPVCRSCNKKRGPAVQVSELVVPRAHTLHAMRCKSSEDRTAA